ncbi:MAG: discoidin domain-containing protein, partial [Bacillota bacterium]|nr:discoidin domain-containing protein [Bacillota bacterium]
METYKSIIRKIISFVLIITILVTNTLITPIFADAASTGTTGSTQGDTYYSFRNNMLLNYQGMENSWLRIVDGTYAFAYGYGGNNYDATRSAGTKIKAISNSDGTVTFQYGDRILVGSTANSTVSMLPASTSANLDGAKWRIVPAQYGYSFIECAAATSGYRLSYDQNNTLCINTSMSYGQQWDVVKIDSNVVFEENFKYDRMLFFNWNNNTGDRKNYQEEGIYVTATSTAQYNINKNLNAFAYGDYTLEGYVLPMAASAGLVFRYNAGVSMYAWALNSSNGCTELFLCNLATGAQTKLSSKYIGINMNTKYKEKIVVKGSMLCLYVDDTLVDVVKNTSSTSGLIGFWAQSPNYPTEVKFYNISVKKLDIMSTTPIPPQVTPYPNPTSIYNPAAGVPTKVYLSHNNFDNSSSYRVTMNILNGNNATSWTLYENGTAIYTAPLTDCSPYNQVAFYDIAGKSPGTYEYTAKLTNAYGDTTSDKITVVVKNTPVLNKPGVPVLSYSTGPNGDYSVHMSLDSGVNGNTWRLYENGVLISSRGLTEASPGAQYDTVYFKYRGSGTYTYTCELVNAAGVTSSDPMDINMGTYGPYVPTPVPSAAPRFTAKPGTPVLSNDNSDWDGNYKITMNMASGNNGTSWKLYENGKLIYQGNLVDNSPASQTASYIVKNKGTGNYTYTCDLINSKGTTSSSSISVGVSNTATSDKSTWETFLNSPNNFGVDSTFGGAYFTGDGFDLLTGSYNESTNDIEIKGKALDVILQRTYNSMTNTEKKFIGNGFRTNFDASLNENSDGSVDVTYPSGSKVHFNNKNGVLTAPKSSSRDKVEKSGTDYIVTRMDDLSKLIFRNGKLITIKDRYDNVNNIIYSNDRYVAVTDQFGRSINFEYLSNGMIGRAYDFTGREAKYVYDANLNLTGVTDPDGNTTTYKYDSNNRVNEIVNGNGVSTAKMVYDSQGRMTSQTDGEGNVKNYAFNGSSRTVNTTRKILNDNGTFSNTSTSSTINFNINYKSISETDDLGNVTQHNYYYTKDNATWIDVTNLTKDSQAAKDYETAQNDNTIVATREIITDPYGYKTTKDCNSEYLPSVETDNLGYTTTTTYDAYGNTLTQKDKGGYTTKYEYDTTGRKLLKVTDAIGNYKTYDYYNGPASGTPDTGILTNGLIKSTSEYKKTVQADPASSVILFDTSTFYYNDIYNDRTNTVIRSNSGPISSFFESYDDIGRVVESTDDRFAKFVYTYNNKSKLKTEYAYDPTGLKIKGTRYEYDKAGNLVKNIAERFVPGPNAASEDITTTYTYDKNNQEASKTDPEGYVTTKLYNAQGKVIEEKDEKGNYTRYEYDGGMRLTKVIDREGKITRTEYSKVFVSNNQYKEVQKVTEPSGKVTQNEKDAMGRTVKSTVQYYKNGTLKEEATLYTFNGLGKTLSVVDPKNFKNSFAYDGIGRTITSIIGDGYKDANGNDMSLVKSVSYNYIVTNRTSSEQNVLITAYMGRSLSSYKVRNYNNQTVYEIDELGNSNSYSYNFASDLTSMTNANGKTVYNTYDSLGKLITNTDAVGRVFTAKYDSVGNKIEETDACGNKTTYQYDKLGRIVKKTDPLGNITATSYLLTTDSTTGKKIYKIQVTNPIGSINTTVYDSMNRTSEESVSLLEGGVSKTKKLTYAYDTSGFLKEVTNPVGKKTQYTYDTLGRVISIQDGVGATDNTGKSITIKQDFDYDIITEGTLKYDVTIQKDYLDGSVVKTTQNKTNAQGFMVEEKISYFADNKNKEKKTTKEYDPRGNVLKITNTFGKTITNEYDVMGRLVKSTDPNGKTKEFAYDALGNKIKAVDERKNTTLYEYDGANRVTKMTDPLGNVTETNYSFVATSQGVKNIVTVKNRVSGALSNYDSQNLIDKNLALGKPATASKELSYESAANAVNGTTYADTGSIHDKWCTNYGYGSNSWLQVDLGRVMNINRWKVVHESGSGSGYSNLYTRDFRLQASPDGINNWKDIDVVKGNTLGITDRRVQTFNARYVRLFIDLPDIDDCARIYEFQLYNDSLVRESYTQYDALSRPEFESSSFTDGNKYTGAVKSTVYNASGSVVETTDTSGKVTRTTYDQIGRVLQIVDGVGLKNSSGGSMERTLSYAYDSYAQGSFNLDRVTETNSLGDKTISISDVFGRPYIQTDTMGNNTTYQYDSMGNMVSKTDVENNVWKYNYDPFGRIIKDTDPLGKSATAEYDELGRNTARVNRKGGRAEFTYDVMGNLASTKDPYGNIISYTYDEVGNKLSMTDPKSKTVYYSYDALSRMTSETDQVGNACYYGYDSLGRKIWQTDRKLHASSEAGVIQIQGKTGLEYRTFTYYGYDVFGRLTSVIDEAGNTSNYTYGITGKIASQTDPANKTILYKYDG